MTLNYAEFVPQGWLPEPVAAAYINYSPRTLQKWRLAGSGPQFAKRGGRVRYAVHELDRWMADSQRQSTSDQEEVEGQSVMTG